MLSGRAMRTWYVGEPGREETQAVCERLAERGLLVRDYSDGKNLVYRRTSLGALALRVSVQGRFG
jgi:hypothetical protein